MKVYHPGARVRRVESHIMCIAPAADVHDMEIPADWLEHDGKPKQINVEFKQGVAEVEDSIGRYLIAKGYAKKTKLFLPSEGAVPEDVAGLDPIYGEGG